MKAAEKAALYRELAKLTAADFHLDRSVALLLAQKPRGGRLQILHGLQRGLAAGKSVAASMGEENGHLVSGLESSLIEAGERSGTLSNGFAHLAHYFAATDKATRQARSAILYPLVLAHLAIILPELPAAVAPDGHNPTGTIALFIALLWVLILGGACLWRWLSHRAETSMTVDRFLRRIPLIGAVRRHWALARFAQVFHAGLLAALRMSEIVRLAGQSSQSGEIQHASEAAAKIVEKGEPLSMSLAETGAFPADFIHVVATAEEIGSLDNEMERWAGAETALASEAIERASIWLPKIGYGIVVLFVIYRIYTMVEGYYGGIAKQLEAF